MKQLSAFLLLCAGTSAHAQLSISDSLSTSAIGDMLLGDNISIFNVAVNCAPAAMGQFNGLSEVPIEQGLALTSGSADQLAGPVSNFVTTSNNGTGDMDLNAELGGLYPTYDACVLEFDCVPEGDTLLFNFAFGSEEYPEYVGSNFNDIFAIYLSGPGYTPQQNVAAIPGGTVVAINNVNAGLNSAYFIDNEAQLGQYVAYDGFTQNLTAFAVVTPGETYHFKVAIADVADGIFDSGVMLEAFSFRSVGFSTGIHAAGLPQGPQARVLDGRLDLVLLGSVANATAEIVDANGRVARQFRVQGTEMSIDVTALQPGAYTVRFMTGEAIQTLRFAKDH